MSVSRQHCSLETKSDGTLLLTNLKLQNVTNVNGQTIQSKTVSSNDLIQLGVDGYTLSWSHINAMLPQVVDIRPLKRVWENYNAQMLALQIAERKFNALRSVTSVIPMIAIALAILVTRDNPIFIALYAIAIGLSIAFFIKNNKDASGVPVKQQQYKKDLQRDYVCPNCKHFFGFNDYDVLVRNHDKCPHCKALFKK